MIPASGEGIKQLCSAVSLISGMLLHWLNAIVWVTSNHINFSREEVFFYREVALDLICHPAFISSRGLLCFGSLSAVNMKCIRSVSLNPMVLFTEDKRQSLI